MAGWKSRILGLLAVLMLASCGGEPKNETRELRAVTFATDWVAQAEQGGFYQALALGLYEERGLDVTIRPGGPGVNVPQLIAAGSVEFGMGSNSFIPMNIAKEGVPAKAVMAAFQKDPQVLITHPREDISTIADMKGKPILISDATRSAWWPWLEAKYGFDETQIRKYSGSVAPFLINPDSIQQGYVTSEPYLIERELGQLPEVYLLADHGYPSYAAMVLASTAIIDAEPDTVAAFVEASIEGWRSYLEGDPTPGNERIMADNPDMSEEFLDQARRKLIQYNIVIPPAESGESIGAMTDDRWATFYATMRDAGVYEEEFDYAEGYTLDFLTTGDDLNSVGLEDE